MQDVPGGDFEVRVDIKHNVGLCVIFYASPGQFFQGIFRLKNG
jgi:hypothetical protein